jgi:hypothetical protein
MVARVKSIFVGRIHNRTCLRHPTCTATSML